MRKNIEISTEYIKLGQLLKFAGIISNGSEAKDYLENNDVYVNDEKENRRGRKIYPGYLIKTNGVEVLVNEIS